MYAVTIWRTEEMKGNGVGDAGGEKKVPGLTTKPGI